jgi:hypothetical protein
MSLYLTLKPSRTPSTDGAKRIAEKELGWPMNDGAKESGAPSRWFVSYRTFDFSAAEWASMRRQSISNFSVPVFEQRTTVQKKRIHVKPNLTRVDTIHVPRLRSVSLRFGRPVRRETVTATQKCHYFTPDSTFAMVRWHGNEYGTTLWQLSIMRAVRPQQAASSVLGVTPGAEVLLRVSAITNVRWVLSLIRRIEARGLNAAEVSPDYWCCVQNRLSARVAVPEYGAAEHAAYLNRLKCVS